MKYSQAVWLVVLWSFSIPGYSFQLRVEQSLPPNAESVGQQFIDIILERESGDGTAACQVDGNVDAIDNPASGLQDAIDGLDYVAQSFSFSLTLLDNEDLVSARFPVTVLDDVIFEGDETFTAIVPGAEPFGCSVSPPQPASIQIIDDDVASVDLSFVQTVTEVDETAGTLTLGVTLVGAATVDDTFSVQVNFNTVDGSATAGLDYATSGLGILGFNVTTLTQFITIAILDDALIEGSENFQIALSGAVGFIDDGVPFAPNILTPTMTVIITDDENPPGNIVFANPPLTAAEGAGVTLITLSRVNGNSGVMQIDVASADGTATAGLDYTAIATTLTWADGDNADQTISLGILDDGLVEGDETLILALRNPNNPGAPAVTETLTIFDDDTNAGVQFTTASVTTTEDVGTLTLTVSRMGNSTGPITVDFVTADGTATQSADYTSAAGTLTWTDGDLTDQTISVDITNDTTDEADEDFTVSLFNLTGQATLGANNPVTVTISSNDTTRNVSDISTLTPNQRSLATFFDNLCPRLDQADGGTTAGQQDLDGVCKSIRGVGTTDAQVASALDAINPDELFAAPINALRLTAIQHVNLSQRFSALRGGATGIDLAGLNIEINGVQISGRELTEFVNKLFGGGASSDDPWGKWGFFIDGKISTGEKDASLFESGFDFDLYGFTVGLDYRIKQNFIIGAAAGYGVVDTDYHGSKGGLDIESWNGSVFLTYFTENTFYFDALATYGRNDYDSRLNYQIFTGYKNVTIHEVSLGLCWEKTW